MQIRIKRVYETPVSTDGHRVLVDRPWPRGLTKKDAAIDVWAKELAPSNKLRKWFAHKDERFAEFTRRYRFELDNATVEIERLLSSIADGTVTLLYAASNRTSNHAIVLKSQLEHHLAITRKDYPTNLNGNHTMVTTYTSPGRFDGKSV